MKLLRVNTYCHVLEFDDGSELFFSYRTPVAGFRKGKGYFRVAAPAPSSTTTRHINDYLAENKEGAVEVLQAAIDVLCLLTPLGGIP